MLPVLMWSAALASLPVVRKSLRFSLLAQSQRVCRLTCMRAMPDARLCPKTKGCAHLPASTLVGEGCMLLRMRTAAAEFICKELNKLWIAAGWANSCAGTLLSAEVLLHARTKPDVLAHFTLCSAERS